MIQKTVLEVVGPYGKDGWEDPETGENFFNDRVFTPHGLLGKIKSHIDGEDLVIDQADQVVLIRKGFPEEWTAPTIGASLEQSPFGFFLFELKARNGMVRYVLLNDELSWRGSEEGDTESLDKMLATHQLATLTYSKWVAEGDAPPRTRNIVDTFSANDIGKKRL